MTRRLPGLAILCALALAGCGVPAQTAPLATTESTPPPKPTKPYKVEDLAAAVNCTPEFQGKTTDFRQAGCKAKGEDYLLLDFVTDKGQQAWLDNALIYGGTYLVGERWILSSSSEKAMKNLYDELGGTIKQDKTMGASHNMG
jgi:hypothetical protein